MVLIEGQGCWSDLFTNMSHISRTMVGVQQIFIEWTESVNGYHEGSGSQGKEKELDSVG